MKNRYLIAILAVALLSGCGKQYVYHGTISAACSDNEIRDHQIWWRKTIRKFWFDGADGSVRLQARCVAKIVVFDETAEGIYFLCGPNDEGAFDEVAVKDPCGRILTANKVEDLPEGTIELEIWCNHMEDEFDLTTGGAVHFYLKASETPYRFEVMRSPASNFEGGAPKLECEETADMD